MKKVVSVFQLAARAFTNLKANDPIRMAAATAFFTFFALPPIVIILSQVYGGLLTGNEQWVSGQLFRKLAELFGYQGAKQLQDISRNLQQPRSSPVLSILTVVVLLLASTTLFAIIKNSLNQLWNVKPVARSRFLYALLDKVVALGIIVFTGLLFGASMAVHRALAMLKEHVALNADTVEWARQGVLHALSVLALTVWFGVVFKYLPNIRIRWQAVWVGGLVTAILVEMGEQVLDRLLINSPVRTLYGSSGAIILVLLFVFYSSLIFYYGASFTRQYAQWINAGAEPGAHSVAYQIKELEGQKPI